MKRKRRGHGAGHIRERVLVGGETRFDVLVKVDGKQKKLATVSTREKAEAYIAINAVERAAANKFVSDDIGFMTLKKLGEVYLAALPPSRLETDRSRWNARVETAEFIDWPLSQIDENAVRRWVDLMARTEIASGKGAGKRPSRSTLQNSLNLLRGAFRWARIRGFTDHNPAKSVTIRESTITAPRTSSQGEVYDYLRDAEVRKLLEAELPLAQKTAFTLLAFTGARPKDLYLLTWDRVDIKGATILYRTHKKHRNYPAHLLPLAHEAIRAWWMAHGQPSEGLVFPGQAIKGRDTLEHVKGYDWGWSDAEPLPGKVWKGYRSRAGIKRRVPLYALRHTCACQLLLGSELFTGGRVWSFEEIASHLGHSDLSTVRRYAIALGVSAKRAVEESRVALRKTRKGDS